MSGDVFTSSGVGTWISFIGECTVLSTTEDSLGSMLLRVCYTASVKMLGRADLYLVIAIYLLNVPSSDSYVDTPLTCVMLLEGGVRVLVTGISGTNAPVTM